jgi:hypothetical protein
MVCGKEEQATATTNAMDAKEERNGRNGERAIA